MLKRKIAIGVTSLFVGLVIATAGFLALVPRAEAKGQCHSINTTLASVADFTTFTTEGEIKSGFLKGTTMFIGDPLSLTPIMSTDSPPIIEAATFSYTGDLQIATNKGTLTTRSVGVFEGVPFGLGTQFDHVIDGTGQFDGAEGFLSFSFEADETGGAFTSAVTGKICVD